VFSSISQGDDANQTIIKLFSHSGTHLDTPKHFYDAGPAAIDLPIESFVFFKPIVLNIPRPEGGFITAEDLTPYEADLAQADLVFFLTGWSSWRSSDPERYASTGPLLHPDAAIYLVENFSNIRGIAIDTVSIGAADDMENSIAVHRILMGAHHADGRFILVFEDVQVSEKLATAARIYAWPLLIEGSDGSPCTIVAEFK
jgi:kynurenine formamidase